MTCTLRYLHLLALIVWIGGIIFLSFVIAPLAFHSMPTTHLAGIIVGGSLRVLHTIGLICAAVLIATTLLLSHGKHLRWILAIAAVMFALTAWSQYRILPRMDAARDANGGDIPVGCTTQPCRTFQRLHHRSVHAEVLVLLGGLTLTGFLSSRED